jgi:hypothetical protein
MVYLFKSRCCASLLKLVGHEVLALMFQQKIDDKHGVTFTDPVGTGHSRRDKYLQLGGNADELLEEAELLKDYEEMKTLFTEAEIDKLVKETVAGGSTFEHIKSLIGAMTDAL